MSDPSAAQRLVILRQAVGLMLEYLRLVGATPLTQLEADELQILRTLEGAADDLPESNGVTPDAEDAA